MYCITLSPNIDSQLIFQLQHVCRPSMSDISVLSILCCIFRVHVVVEPHISFSAVANIEWKMLTEFFGLLDHVVSKCIAIPGRKISNVIAFIHMTRDVIDWVFVRRVSEIFCRILSSCFIYCFLCSVYKMSFCVFRRWCRSSLFDWDRILNFVFINLDCRRRYLDYFKRSCPRGRQIVVQHSRQTVWRTCSHW